MQRALSRGERAPRRRYFALARGLSTIAFDPASEGARHCAQTRTREHNQKSDLDHREGAHARSLQPTNTNHPTTNPVRSIARARGSTRRAHTPAQIRLTCPWLPNRLVTEDSRPIEVPGTLLLQSVSKPMAYCLMMTSFDNSAVVGPHVKSVTKRASYGGETFERNPLDWTKTRCP